MDSDYNYKLCVHFEECDRCITTIQQVQDVCKSVAPTASNDVIGKIMARIFEVKITLGYINEKRIVVYTNICKRNNSTPLPGYCTLTQQTDTVLNFKCPTTYIINFEPVNYDVSLTKQSTTIEINKKKIIIPFGLPLNRSSINGVLHLLQNMKWCNGVSGNAEMPKSFRNELRSKIVEPEYQEKIAYSKSCSKILPILGRNKTCKSCHDTYSTFTRRKNHEISEERNETPQIEWDNAEDSNEPRPIKSIKLTTPSTVLKTSEVTSIEEIPNEKPPNEEDVINLQQKDIETLLKNVAGDFKIFLESQLRHSELSDPRRRRWDPKIIQLCLGIWTRSHEAYQFIIDSGMLLLPSIRTLQYYKQKSGFTDE